MNKKEKEKIKKTAEDGEINTKQLKKDSLISSLVGETVENSKLKFPPEKTKKDLLAMLTDGASEEPEPEMKKPNSSTAPKPENRIPKPEELPKNKSTKTTKAKSSAELKRSDLVSLLAGEKELPKPASSPVRDPSQGDSDVNPPVAGVRNSPVFKKNKNHDLIAQLINENVPVEHREEYFKNLSQDINYYKFHDPKNKRKQGDVFLFHWNGRFGNRMHTYAYIHNRAKKLNGKVLLPSHWEGSKLFNLDYEILEDPELLKSVNQSIAPFDSFQYRLEATKEFCSRSPIYDFRYVNPDNPEQTYTDYKQGACVDSVSAYHHKIFDEMKLSDVLKLYEFSDEVKNLDLYKRMEDKQGTYDIAHLRRDDISNVNYKLNGGYSVISKKSYLKAFEKYGYNPEEIEWTSDDWSNKWGVGNSLSQGTIKARGAWRYPEGSQVLPEIMFDWFPDFLRIYFARSIFRANSSFSFWACTLAKGRETPPKIFAPRLDKRILYASKENYEEEAEFNFEEGNHPHWLCISGKDNCDDIVFSDEPKPKKSSS